MALQVELVSPEGIVYSGEANAVIARTTSGDIAFLDGHAPFLGALEIATATLVTDSGEEQVAVHGGFVEVNAVPAAEPDEDAAGAAGSARDSGAGGRATKTVVTILSDIAELARDIDISRARQAKERAQEKLGAGANSEAEAELRRAHVRLAAAEGL